jgi:hypothetical protein
MMRWAAGYLFAVAVLAGGMTMRLRGVPESKGPVMTWTEVKEVRVPAKPTGLWTWAVDYVRGPARILIEATEGPDWWYSPGHSCGPDGDLGALLTPAHLLLPAAPVGALLVKVGGSTAGAADGTVRVAGAKAFVEIDGRVSGPIFLTINDELSGMADNTGELKVTISIAPQPAAAPATESQPAKP